MLFRHSVLHQRQDPVRGERGTNKPTSYRVGKACTPCALAKAKCNNEKPCRRCLKREIDCLPGSTVASEKSFIPRPEAADTFVQPALQDAQQASDCFGEPVELPDSAIAASCEQELGAAATLDTALFSQRGVLLENDAGSAATPTLFTPAMQSASNLWDGDQDLDLLWDPFDSPLLYTFCGEATGCTTVACRMEESQKAFLESPLYSPDSKIGDRFVGRQGESYDSSDQERVRLLSTNVWSDVPKLFDQRVRDRIMVKLAVDYGTDNIVAGEMEFPSPALLDLLTDRSLRRQECKVDSWIHPPSYDPSMDVFELTCMILAAGAFSTHIASLRDWGWQVFKAVQGSLVNKVRVASSNPELNQWLTPALLLQLEIDCASSKPLPLLQALLIGLELDSWTCDHSCLLQRGALTGVLHRVSPRVTSFLDGGMRIVLESFFEIFHQSGIS